MIQLACARTFHRAQGLRMKKVVFNPKEIRKHGLLYTALSCVKYIESLYLLSILKEKKIHAYPKGLYSNI